MSLDEYKLQVQVATTARELHDITSTAKADSELPVSQFLHLDDLISDRFSQLNAAKVGTPKPRWS